MSRLSRGLSDTGLFERFWHGFNGALSLCIATTRSGCWWWAKEDVMMVEQGENYACRGGGRLGG